MQAGASGAPPAYGEEDDAFDAWVPVEMDAVDRWREAALTGEALASRGKSLDVILAPALAGLSRMRLTQSTGALAGLRSARAKTFGSDAPPPQAT